MDRRETGKDNTYKTIRDLIESEDVSTIQTTIDDLPPSETMRVFARLGKSHQSRFLDMLKPSRLAAMISKAAGLGSLSLLSRMSPSKRASVVKDMPREGQLKAFRWLKNKDAVPILRSLRPRRAKAIEAAIQFSEETAGGLMITEYLSYSSNLTVDEVLEDLRRNSERYTDYDIQYAYVVSSSGQLVGVLRLRDILLSPRGKLLEDIMIGNPLKVDIDASLKDLLDFFVLHPLIGAPVVNNDGSMLGVVRNASVREANDRQSNQLFMRFAGIVGGEEYRTMPLVKRSSRRLSWLSINIILNIIAASVIALYQDTLERAIVLAVFLPIISDMSGCSGNQAVAVSIRELTLGLVRPRELFHVLKKEASIGLINGLVLGCLLGLAAFAWKGNPYLGLVVGTSLAANTLVAVSIGGLVPLVLRGMRTDPALASGPLLTTITDMCGFFFVLSFAAFMLPRLAA